MTFFLLHHNTIAQALAVIQTYPTWWAVGIVAYCLLAPPLWRASGSAAR